MRHPLTQQYLTVGVTFRRPYCLPGYFTLRSFGGSGWAVPHGPVTGRRRQGLGPWKNLVLFLLSFAFLA